jgi:periplasmic protein CpxP/Spy
MSKPAQLVDSIAFPRRSWIGKTVAAAGFVGLAGLTQAQSAPGGSMGGKAGRSPWGMDPERMLQRRVSHMLDMVEASPEQRSKVIAIAKAAHTDLAALREKRRASRDKGLDMLGGATVDRAGLERLRQEQMAVVDAMGQRKLAGLMDTFDVLSPSQRATLVKRMKERGMGHGGMQPGMHHGQRPGMGTQPGPDGRKP